MRNIDDKSVLQENIYQNMLTLPCTATQVMESMEVISRKPCSIDLNLRHGSTASKLLFSSKSSANSATSNVLDICKYIKYELITRTGVGELCCRM